MSNSILEIRAHVTRSVRAAIFDCVVAPYLWDLTVEIKEVSALGDLNTVKYLISIGADTTTAVLCAAQHGHLSLVMYLVSIYKDVFVENDQYDQLLYISAALGNLDMAKYLISAGADAHFESEHALRIAAERGHLDLVKYLVSIDAEIHAKGYDAICAAASNGYFDVVHYLFLVCERTHSGYYDAIIRATAFGYTHKAGYLNSEVLR
jgi:hypothetical protein